MKSDIRAALRALLDEATPPRSSAERLAEGHRGDPHNDPGHPEARGEAVPNTNLARVVRADEKRAARDAETDAAERRLDRHIAEREGRA